MLTMLSALARWCVICALSALFVVLLIPALIGNALSGVTLGPLERLHDAIADLARRGL